MILSDKSLYDIIVNHSQLIVDPFNEEDLQPNSIDLHLSDDLKTLDGKSINIGEQSYKIKPNEFLLGSTIERVNVPLDLVAHIDGKSSLGRLGLFIHVSSGFVDSGFMGNITLEIYNCSHKEFELKEGMPICQVVFETLTTQVMHPYGSDKLNSHYQGSEGTVRSRYEFE